MDADQPTGHPIDPAEHRMSTTLRASWYYVLVAALTIGGWSVYHLLYARLHLPWLIAVGGALVFDGAGLIFSEYARAAIERGRGFLLPALLMLGTVATSSYINYSHGISLGWGTAGGAVLGAVPVLLETLFVAHVLDARMTALKDGGLLPERLPRVGILGAILFPKRSFKAVRTVVGRRLDAIEHGPPTPVTVIVERVGTPALNPPPEPPPTRRAVENAQAAPAADASAPAAPVAVSAPVPVKYANPKLAAIRELYNDGTRPGTKAMVAAVLTATGEAIGGSTARHHRQIIEAVEEHLATLPEALANTEVA